MTTLNEVLAHYYEQTSITSQETLSLTIDGVTDHPLNLVQDDPTIWVDWIQSRWEHQLKDMGLKAVSVVTPDESFSNLLGSSLKFERAMGEELGCVPSLAQAMLPVLTYFAGNVEKLTSKNLLNELNGKQVAGRELGAKPISVLVNEVQVDKGEETYVRSLLGQQVASDLALQGYEVIPTSVKEYRGVKLIQIATPNSIPKDKMVKLGTCCRELSEVGIFVSSLEILEARNIILYAQDNLWLDVVTCLSPQVFFITQHLSGLLEVGGQLHIPTNVYVVNPMETFFLDWNIGFEDLWFFCKMLCLAGIKVSPDGKGKLVDGIKFVSDEENEFIIAFESHKLKVTRDGIFDDRDRRVANCMVIPNLQSTLDGMPKYGKVINPYAQMVWVLMSTIKKMKEEENKGEVGSVWRELIKLIQWTSTDEVGCYSGGARQMYDDVNIGVSSILYNGYPFRPGIGYFQEEDKLVQYTAWGLTNYLELHKWKGDNGDNKLIVNTAAMVDLYDQINSVIMCKGAQPGFRNLLTINPARIQSEPIRKWLIEQWAEKHGKGQTLVEKIQSLVPNGCMKGLNANDTYEFAMSNLRMLTVTKTEKGTKRLSLQFAVTAVPLPSVEKEERGLFPAVTYQTKGTDRALAYLLQKSPSLGVTEPCILVHNFAIMPAGVQFVLGKSHSKPHMVVGRETHGLAGVEGFDPETYRWYCKDNNFVNELVKIAETSINYTAFVTKWVGKDGVEHLIEGVKVAKDEVVLEVPVKGLDAEGNEVIIYDAIPMPEDGILQEISFSVNSFDELAVDISYVTIVDVAKERSLKKAMPIMPFHGDKVINNALNREYGYEVKSGVTRVVTQDVTKFGDSSVGCLYYVAQTFCEQYDLMPNVIKQLIVNINSMCQGVGEADFIYEKEGRYLAYDPIVASLGLYDKLVELFAKMYGKPIWILQAAAEGEMIAQCRKLYTNKIKANLEEGKAKDLKVWLELPLEGKHPEWLSEEGSAWLQDFRAKTRKVYGKIPEGAVLYTQGAKPESLTTNILFFPNITITAEWGVQDVCYQRTFGYYAEGNQPHVLDHICVELCTIPQAVSAGDTMQAVARSLAAGIGEYDKYEATRISKLVSDGVATQFMGAVLAMNKGVSMSIDGEEVKVLPLLNDKKHINQEIVDILDAYDPNWLEQLRVGSLGYLELAEALDNVGITIPASLYKLRDDRMRDKPYLVLKALASIKKAPGKESLPYLAYRFIRAAILGMDGLDVLAKRVGNTLNSLAKAQGTIKTMIGKKSLLCKTVSTPGVPTDEVWIKWSKKGGSVYQLLRRVYKEDLNSYIKKLETDVVELAHVIKWATEQGLVKGEVSYEEVVSLLKTNDMETIISVAMSRAPLPFSAVLKLRIIWEGDAVYEKLDDYLAYHSAMAVLIDAGDSDGDGRALTLIPCYVGNYLTVEWADKVTQDRTGKGMVDANMGDYFADHFNIKECVPLFPLVRAGKKGNFINWRRLGLDENELIREVLENGVDAMATEYLAPNSMYETLVMASKIQQLMVGLSHHFATEADMAISIMLDVPTDEVGVMKASCEERKAHLIAEADKRGTEGWMIRQQAETYNTHQLSFTLKNGQPNNGLCLAVYEPYETCLGGPGYAQYRAVRIIANMLSGATYSNLTGEYIRPLLLKEAEDAGINGNQIGNINLAAQAIHQANLRVELINKSPYTYQVNTDFSLTDFILLAAAVAFDISKGNWMPTCSTSKGRVIPDTSTKYALQTWVLFHPKMAKWRSLLANNLVVRHVLDHIQTYMAANGWNHLLYDKTTVEVTNGVEFYTE